MRTHNYNPDVLTSLANLSNDEVFTPPDLANKMLDLLPNEIWNNPKAKFLDPFSKSGVFLREITKRLIKGLKDFEPDIQKRVDHILKHQVYGIGITELTALMSRRSLYCSKQANGEYSITTAFDNEEGNIVFERIEHNFSNGKCTFCGASQNVYDRGEELETHAYQFIHDKNPFKNMQFDVIIGNPPYGLTDGGGTGDSATTIYQLFVQQAIKLEPKYLVMIIPSRWMKGGKGLTQFRKQMLDDKRISYIYDYEHAKECFPGVNIDGGVCYFLWDSNHNSEADFYYKPFQDKEIFSRRYLKNEFLQNVIRDHRQISIIEKVANKNEKIFSEIVSSRKPFGIATDLFNSPNKYGYKNIPKKEFPNSYKIYGVKGNKGGAKRIVGFIDKNKIEPNLAIKKYKLFQSYAYSTNSTVPPKIIIGHPNEICTETFLMIGPFDNIKATNNCLAYTKTKFYRALLYFNRIQKNLSQATFVLIPLQDFTESWTDEKLYKKYGLTTDEINYIENTIQPMD